jgi:glucose-6-phosphate isomerase
MDLLKLDVTRAISFLPSGSFEISLKHAEAQHPLLLSGKGKGNDFLGWVHLPSEITPELLGQIREDGDRLSAGSQIVIVVGIGGSYLGARAVIEALNHPFDILLPVRRRPVILYAGENLSEDYHSSMMDLLDIYDYSVVVISKSGTTTEPAVAFRILKAHLEKKYGRKGAAERIIAITDASRGALKVLAGEEGYSTYVIPDDVGGRYSVLTPVGLLPVAVAGFDVEKLTYGAREMQQVCIGNPDSRNNPAIQYAAIRNALYKQGNTVEMLVNYQPDLFYITEWWKQLFGESEGKENKGIFPAGAGFTTDLHSLGQYIQEGLRILFETTLSIDHPRRELTVPQDSKNLDGLNFLSGKRISEINRMAELGTLLAHIDGGVPNIRINLPTVDEENLGQLIYFFEFACAISGYSLGVNPFDQPGVEAYKKNMFALLNKPGFEKEGKALRKKLEE